MGEYTGKNEIIKKLDGTLKQIKGYTIPIATLETIVGTIILLQSEKFRPTDISSTVYGLSSIAIGGTLMIVGSLTLNNYVDKIRDTIKSCQDYVINQEPKK
jgi:hypothetical protein